MSWEKKKLQEFFDTHYLLKEKERLLETEIRNYQKLGSVLGQLRQENERLKKVISKIEPNADLNSNEELATLVQKATIREKYSVEDHSILKLIVGLVKHGPFCFKSIKPISLENLKVLAITPKLRPEVKAFHPTIEFVEASDPSEISTIIKNSEHELILFIEDTSNLSISSCNHMTELFAGDDMVAAAEGFTDCDLLSGKFTMIARPILLVQLKKHPLNFKNLQNYILKMQYKISTHPLAATTKETLTRND